jgi:hypothetical protein
MVDIVSPPAGVDLRSAAPRLSVERGPLARSQSEASFRAAAYLWRTRQNSSSGHRNSGCTAKTQVPAPIAAIDSASA